MKVSVGGLQVKIFFRGGLGLLAKGGSARFMFFWGGSFYRIAGFCLPILAIVKIRKFSNWSSNILYGCQVCERKTNIYNPS